MFDSLFSLLQWLWQWIWRPVTRQRNYVIESMFVYPIKSCAGIKMDAATLTPSGFKYDRHWVITDHKHKFITQRQFPKMALIRPTVEQDVLNIEAPGQDRPLRIPLKPNLTRQSVTVRVWDDDIEGFDEGEEAAAWLSAYLNLEARLVVKNPAYRRPLEAKRVKPADYTYETQADFSDGYPLLVVSRASIDDIQGRMHAQDPMYNVSERNFRPNIVVTGVHHPFEEDEWSLIRIADEIDIRLVKKCTRCTIPNVDPDKGEVTMPTLKTLMTYRRVDPSKKYQACVAVNAVHLSPGGTMRIGDKVKVLK